MPMKKDIKCLIPSREAKSSLVVINFIFRKIYLCVCVCVCVCARARGRVDDNFYGIKQHCLFCRRYIVECHL